MIKVLTEKDTDAFIQLRIQGLQKSPQVFAASYQKVGERDQTFINLKNWTEEYFVLVFFEDWQLFGIVGFVRERKLKKMHKSFIWGMYVRPDFRGKGIAKKLLLEVIIKAKKIEGLSKIMLSVTHPQENALQFYELLGFEKYAVENDAIRLDGQKIDEIFMSLQIWWKISDKMMNEKLFYEVCS